MIGLVGPFPPPLHGAASVTLAVASLLDRAGTPHKRFSTSPGRLERSVPYHLRRFFRATRVALALLTLPHLTVVYVAMSGGWGLVYDIVFVLIARMRGVRLVLHHHCFAYCDRRSILMALLVRLAGRTQIHVVLGRQMQQSFARLYPLAPLGRVLSNAAYATAAPRPSPRTGRLRTIGFLANLTREKGIDGFVALVADLRQKGFTGEALVAGPICDPELARVLSRQANRYGITMLGPLDAASRDAFFARLDLFVFPTRYANEAEPLVVIEAQRAGVPVAASQRGCIPDMLIDAPCLRLGPQGEGLDALATEILALTRDAATMDSLRARTTALASARHTGAAATRDRLLALLAPMPSPATTRARQDDLQLPLP